MHIQDISMQECKFHTYMTTIGQTNQLNSLAYPADPFLETMTMSMQTTKRSKLDLIFWNNHNHDS